MLFRTKNQFFSARQIGPADMGGGGPAKFCLGGRDLSALGPFGAEANLCLSLSIFVHLCASPICFFLVFAPLFLSVCLCLSVSRFVSVCLYVSVSVVRLYFFAFFVWAFFSLFPRVRVCVFCLSIPVFLCIFLSVCACFCGSAHKDGTLPHCRVPYLLLLSSAFFFSFCLCVGACLPASCSPARLLACSPARLLACSPARLLACSPALFVSLFLSLSFSLSFSLFLFLSLSLSFFFSFSLFHFFSLFLPFSFSFFICLFFFFSVFLGVLWFCFLYCFDCCCCCYFY